MSESNAPSAPRLKPLFWVALLFVIGGGVAIAAMTPSGSKANKPPAPPAAEVLELRASASGRVIALGAKVGDEVAEDHELIFLNDEKEQNALDQAQQALQLAASQIKSENVAVALPAQGTLTGVFVPGSDRPAPLAGAPARPRGPVTALPSVKGAGTRINVGGDAAVEPEREAPPAPKGEDVGDLQERVTAAEAEVIELEAKIENAKSEAAEGEMEVSTLRTRADQAARDADKKRSLLVQGAISANEANSATIASNVAANALKAAEGRAGDSRAVISGLEAQRVAAIQTRNAAQSALKSAKAAPPRPAARKPRPPRILETRPTPRIPQPGRVIVKRSDPKPIPTRVDVDLGKKMTLDQQLHAARERVDVAEEGILGRRLRAPKGLKLVELLVIPGQELQPGAVVARYICVPRLDAPTPEPFMDQLYRFFADVEKAMNSPPTP